MNALPLIDRELRVGARRSATYWTRCGVVAGVCVVWLLILAASSKATPGHLKALTLFWTVTVVAFGFCLLAGLFLTADCVSEEKRDGTLGLLFLTGLEPYDVLLGKLVSSSLRASYNLLGALPVLALPLLIGGVGLGEFWRVVAELVITLFLSLATGLAISVISRESRQAMVATLAVLVGLAGVPPLIWWVGGTFWPGAKSGLHVLLLASPPFGLASATDALYGAPSGTWSFWACVCVQTGLVILALTVAGVRASGIWTEGLETGVHGRSARWRRFRFGSAAARLRRRQRIEINPIFWLSSRDRLPFVLAWAVLGVLFTIWSLFLAGAFNTAGTKREVCLAVAAFIGYGAFVLWKSFVAIEAARRISEDRQNGALELLLVTKLDVKEMILGQRRAINRLFLGPGLVVLVMNMVLLGMMAGTVLRSQGQGQGITLVVFAVGALLLAADLTALSDVGTWIGLRSRRLSRAFLEMLGRVMLVPWLGVAFFAVTLILGIGLSAEDMFILLFVWILISLAVDAVVGVKARSRLEKEFRRAASEESRSPAEANEEVASEYYSLVGST